MSAVWILRTIYAALMGHAVVQNNQTPITAPPSMIYRPVVRITQGDLRGIQTKATTGGLVDKFLGIPYAVPPVGKLRFAKPLPATGWNGVRDASYFRNECIQPFYARVSNTPVDRSEDCLYLNVYKPVTPSSGILPVMVWIHGGAYLLGAGSQYEGSDLAANDVIVVTINYRLDIFGFLSNEDDIIPGNYGMLDQVLALNWVKANIKSFGGDPDQVTIFGESAGSASVSLLVLSPLASGLFRRGIMESGTSLSPFAFRRPATRIAPRQMLNLVGSMIGCRDTDAVSKLECLRNVDSETLFNASSVVKRSKGFGFYFIPVVETTFGFLPDLPTRLWTQNKFNHVDTVRGFNRAENSKPALSSDADSFTKKSFIDELRASLRPYSFVDKEEFIVDLSQTYVGKETNGRTILLSLIYALSDLDFKGPALMEANIESKMAPEKKHYVYEFVHRPSLSTTPFWLSATHEDEIQFIFGINLKQNQVDGKSPSTGDQFVGKQMQTLWSNFAKYGSPTRRVPTGAVKWNTYNADDAMVLEINVISKERSYKNHSSTYSFPKMLRKINTAIPDNFIVG